MSTHIGHPLSPRDRLPEGCGIVGEHSNVGGLRSLTVDLLCYKLNVKWQHQCGK